MRYSPISGGEDGNLPTFSDSEPGSPPPRLEVKVTHLDKGVQTPAVHRRDRSTSAQPPVSTVDESTQVVRRPHQATSASQNPSSAPTHDQSTQVLLRPPRSWAFTQTERPATSSLNVLDPGPSPRHPRHRHRHAVRLNSVSSIPGGMLF